MHVNTGRHGTLNGTDKHTPPSAPDESDDLVATGDAYLGSVPSLSEGDRGH